MMSNGVCSPMWNLAWQIKTEAVTPSEPARLPAGEWSGQGSPDKS